MSTLAPEKKKFCGFCEKSFNGHKIKMAVLGDASIVGEIRFCPCCDRLDDNGINPIHDSHDEGFNQVSSDEYPE